MEIALPADTMKVSVDLFQDADETPFFTCTLAVGHLDPDETTSGVQARLANLGYYAGPIDGEMNDATREAVIAFRLAELGDETDVVDDAFTEALVKAHNV
jgi:N-acetylmuramoyl-L-alanine amidase